MKSKEALKLLKVSRVTLTSYVKKGLIKVTKLGNGFYEYDDTSIYNFIGKRDRKNVIYARVSTQKQKDDLQRQITYINSYCTSHKIVISTVYSEIESGITLDRPIFQKMLDEIINGQIQAIYISHRDRLSRLSFVVLKSMLSKFNTRIIIVSDETTNNIAKNNNVELYEDLLAMMHYFTTKSYSMRKNPKIFNTI